jgi:hypothetical protein
MEVRYNDGRVEMESFEDMAAAERAMRDRLEQADVLFAGIHKVGSEIVQRGRRYRLNALGQCERVGKKRRVVDDGHKVQDDYGDTPTPHAGGPDA